ncbi:MAG TPA: dipeptidase PepE [Flavobacteriales bacterium]|nr:dipeptidase PepE [Flavobacteriales bacterium]
MKVIIASTSTVYGGSYLDYLKQELVEHFKDVSELLFIPYARPSGLSHDAYTKIAADFFNQINVKVKGLHVFDNPKSAVEKAEAIFTGGGNTFVLVNQLYEKNLLDVLRKKIVSGTPYLGTSAGSNITGQTMKTTNDMPIVYVPDFKTLGIFPFNINPHYLDPAPDLLKHMGETRDTRLKEYLHFNDIPVVALREGSWIKANDEQYILKGELPARIYFILEDIREVSPGTDLKPLFKDL